jgi:uncharacterized protein (UPF0333 family)
MGKKAQISTEYLIIVGFIVVFVIIMLGVALYYSSEIRDKMRENQMEQFAHKVIISAESVYYAGEPSKTTISAYLPSGISKIDVLEREISIEFTSGSGNNKISYLSKVPLEGSISKIEGVKRIVVSALPDKVSISSN